MSILQKLKEWYRGRYIPPENDPNSGLFFIQGDYDRPWVARAADLLIRFWLEHWQWIIGTVLAIIAIFVSA